MKNTAKFITTLPDWRGDARVYELDPPLSDRQRDDDPGRKWVYVVVSAVVAWCSGPETYIFPARKDGDIFTTVDMLELDGSFQGALDHERALNNAGYEVLR
jgi:hypothetical protein